MCFVLFCFHKSDQSGQIRAFRRIVTVLERISSSVVWVWKRVATSREIVPGHSVWMKVIASGGWPAADT